MQLNIYHWRNIDLRSRFCMQVSVCFTLKEMAAQLPPPLVLTYSYLFTVFQRRVFFVWHELAWLCDTNYYMVRKVRSREILSNGADKHKCCNRY